MKYALKNLLVFGLVFFAAVVVRPQQPQIVVETGHGQGEIALRYSPDGRLLASGSADNTIKLWDASNGTELRTLNGHKKGVLSVAFTPDGRTLASGSMDGTIKLWDADSGEELRTISGHTAAVAAVCFSPDGRLLATGSWDGTIKIWNSATGDELRTLKGRMERPPASVHLEEGKRILQLVSGSVSSVAFSPDGSMLAAGSDDATVKLWSARTWETINTLKGHTDVVWSVAFSADGKMLASGSRDKTVKIWDASSGALVHDLEGHTGGVQSVSFSADGRTLASGGFDNAVMLWSTESWRTLRTLTGHTDIVTSVAFSPDGKNLASGGFDHAIRIWEVASGAALRTLGSHTDAVTFTAASPDNRLLAIGHAHGVIELWDTAVGTLRRALKGHHDIVSAISFSPDGKTLASASWDHTVRIWDAGTGDQLHLLRGHTGFVRALAFRPDGKVLATGSADETVRLWDPRTGSSLETFGPFKQATWALAFSPDGRMMAVGGPDYSLRLLDTATGAELLRLPGRARIIGQKQGPTIDDQTRTLTNQEVASVSAPQGKTAAGHAGYITGVTFSPDGKLLATGAQDNTVRLWNVATGEELGILRGHAGQIEAVAFSPDGQVLASASRDHTVKLWSVAKRSLTVTLAGHTDRVVSVLFTVDRRILITGSLDGSVRLWSAADSRELAVEYNLDQGDWAVVTPYGHYDASPRATNLMHWRVGDEIIALNQLKERYYEPGLLAKVLGFNKEPLRDVSRFADPRLYPKTKLQPPAKGSTLLTVTLFNSGGGIGRVQVFVNDKEFLADARDEKLKRDANVAQATLNIDLSKATSAVPGGENDVRIVAWNVEDYISSRGTELIWTAGGPTDKAPPEVYAIVGGISSYAGSQLNLGFAAKDAADIAGAIELGARRLFGADKVHLTLLSTAEDSRAITPTKDNFRKAFVAARQAKPTDILIVYLAGHGVALQRGSDTYCYLTQEARTTDTAALSDSAVREREAITSDELVEWIKQIPALKQVVILDTCAAGAAQKQLRLMDARDASGDAVRAIDRAKDRTGSYILMGSAADAVSYEASQYGQGLLTYALLKGMKGAALQNDEFVDVSKLFQYARDEVEQLAKNISGIQRPIVFAPHDDSFEVGQLKAADKQQIALALPRPMILRPRFLDAQADDDTLELMKALRARLRDESFVTGRGATSPVLVFVDDEEFPGGYRPTGRYTISGNKVTVTLRLRRDGAEIGSGREISGTKDDVPGLATKVLEAVKEAIRKL